jgi:hypothetical protein
MDSARWVLRAFAIAGALVLGIALALFGVGYVLSLPPFPPAGTRDLENSLRSADGIKLSSLVSGDQYCILGLGGNPYDFARRTFPNHTLIGERDILLQRSSTHWHVISIDDKTHTYRAFPIDDGKIYLTDDLASYPICARDLIVSSANASRFGRETRLLHATPVAD